MSDVFTGKRNLSIWIAEDMEDNARRIAAESATEAAEIFAKLHDEDLTVTFDRAVAVDNEVIVWFSVHSPQGELVDDYRISLDLTDPEEQS